jgi:type II secretory pathway pseudopilin PulG
MNRLHDETGETLVELLVTIIVIAIGLVAIVGAFGSIIVASDAHQSMADAEVVVRDYSDAVKAKVAVPKADADYTRCPGASWFSPTAAEFTPPTNWTVQVTGVQYWIPDPSDFPNGMFDDHQACVAQMETACALGPGDDIQTCDPRFDPGFWLVTLKASNARTDYGHEEFETRILARRGNRT